MAVLTIMDYAARLLTQTAMADIVQPVSTHNEMVVWLLCGILQSEQALLAKMDGKAGGESINPVS